MEPRSLAQLAEAAARAAREKDVPPALQRGDAARQLVPPATGPRSDERVKPPQWAVEKKGVIWQMMMASGVRLTVSREPLEQPPPPPLWFASETRSQIGAFPVSAPAPH
jgi:hypothetical protein